jgi:hypothetical protein
MNLTTSKVLRSPQWLGWPLWNICVINDYGYVPLVVSSSRSFTHSWLITGSITRLTRRVSLLEHLYLYLYLYQSILTMIHFWHMVNGGTATLPSSPSGNCLRQVEHIRSHLWHRYSIAVNQVIVATGLSFRSIWAHPCFLVGFVLLDL